MATGVVAAAGATLASILGWRFVTNTVLPQVLRVAVRHYAGPLGDAPAILSRIGGGGSQSVLVLLATQAGPRLVVRAAYLLVRSAARGAAWAVVKVAESGATLGWCLFRRLFGKSDDATTAEAPVVAAPAPLPGVAGALPLSPELIDDYTAAQRAADEAPEPTTYAWSRPAPPTPRADTLFVVDASTDEQQREFEAALAAQATLEVTPAELGSFLSAYDRVHHGRRPMSPSMPATPLERFLAAQQRAPLPSAPPAPLQQQQQQQRSPPAEAASSLEDDWVELTSSTVGQV